MIQRLSQRTETMTKYSFLLLIIGCLTATLCVASNRPSENCDPSLKAIAQAIYYQIAIDPDCQKNTITVNGSDSKEPTILSLNLEQLPIAETHSFYGLASYYNAIHPLIIDHEQNATVALPHYERFTLSTHNTLALIGRFSAILVHAPQITVFVSKKHLTIQFPKNQPVRLTFKKVDKAILGDAGDDLNIIRYTHLWYWLASLSRMVEWSVVKIHEHIIKNWGLAIIILAIIIKILLLPISLLTTHLHNQVARQQTILIPQLANIKSQYDGEEAHNRIMAAYKTLGITPFYTLKPMMISLLQIPILIAVFNALGEMSQLNGASFLWIHNLAYPDAIAHFSITMPLLGNTLNLLPFIMTIITLLATSTLQNKQAHKAIIRRQKNYLYMMSIAFFILFYPFPSAMVLYWTLASGLHIIQQLLTKKL